MSDNTFELRIYGWQELGQLYCPELTPASAAKRIKRWIYEDEKIMSELTGLGYKKGKRLLTPLQVEAIVRYMGPP